MYYQDSILDPDFSHFLNKRIEENLYRTFGPKRDQKKSDFYSNDYLGLSDNPEIRDQIVQLVQNGLNFGSSGSRLVSGQNESIEKLEALSSSFFKTEEAIFFPNGYMANLALLSAIPTRHDTIIYDEECHVSLKDGMRLSLAKKMSFKHNDLADLEKKLKPLKGKIYVVAEGIYSMSGSLVPITETADLCDKYEARLIIDEAHSTGTIGEKGEGIVISSQMKKKVWARIYTFGKALGASGAFLAINQQTKQMLVNKAHPLIYSTSPSPIQCEICFLQLKHLIDNPTIVSELQRVIKYWNEKTFEGNLNISRNFSSPIQYCIKRGNTEAIILSKYLQNTDIQIKAMLSPTVPKGNERLRITLHRTNTSSEIDHLLETIRNFENIF